MSEFSFVECVCEHCGEKFSRSRTEYKWSMIKGRRLFCSRRCSGLYKQAQLRQEKRRIAANKSPINQFKNKIAKIIGIHSL